MREQNPKIPILLLIGAFVFALGFRFIRLGVLPLSNLESEIALQALAVGRGERVVFGPFMSIVGLTGLDFFLFSSSNFLARFWGALFGTLIVFVPFIFRKQIGLWPAVVASLILAISPDMVGLSRILGSPVTALVCLLLAVGFYLKRKPILSGMLLALGLMSGSAFWMGLIILGISLWISSGLFDFFETYSLAPINNKRRYWTRFGGSFLAAILIIGSSFSLAPEGLSGVFGGLAAFIGGFGKPFSAPLFLKSLALVAYTLPAVLLGVWGAVRGVLLRNKLDMFLLVWVLVGLAFVLLYPQATPADIVWVTLPLWILSSRVIVAVWQAPDSDWLVVAGTAVMMVVISAFILISLRTLISPTLPQDQRLNYLIAILGGVVLLVAIALLVMYGWSQSVALPGVMIGFGVVIVAGMIALSVNTTGLGPERTHELWFPDDENLTTRWLTIEMDRVIDWNESGGSPVDVAVSNFEPAGLVWALRDHNPVSFVPYLAPSTQPGIVITDELSDPQISNSYRGQDLVWSTRVSWEGLSAYDYLMWLITRDVPTEEREIILWVRTDLMPDAQFAP